MSEKDGSGLRLRNAAPTQRSSEDPVSCTVVIAASIIGLGMRSGCGSTKFFSFPMCRSVLWINITLMRIRMRIRMWIRNLVFLFEMDPDSNPVPDFNLMWLRIRILIRIRLITLMRIWIRYQASRPFKKCSNRLIFNTFWLVSANWCGSGSGFGSSLSIWCRSGSWFLFDVDPDFCLMRIQIRVRIQVTKIMRTRMRIRATTLQILLFWCGPGPLYVKVSEEKEEKTSLIFKVEALRRVQTDFHDKEPYCKVSYRVVVFCQVCRRNPNGRNTVGKNRWIYEQLFKRFRDLSAGF